jgi:MFS family permease
LAALVAAVAWHMRGTADTSAIVSTSPSREADSRRWFAVLFACYTLEGVGYIIAGTFLVAAIGQHSAGWVGNGAWIVVGLAAAPSAALWASAGTRWSHPTLLTVALTLQAAGIALPALVGGVAPALIGAVLFGGTFIGVSTIAMAAGRALAFPRAVAVLTSGYSVGQILGPLLVSPLLHQGVRYGFRYALIASAVVVSTAALMAIWLRAGCTELSRRPLDGGRRQATTLPDRPAPIGPGRP